MSNLATIVNNILADSGIDDINVVVTTGSYSNPAWITALSWSKITSTPTTLSGYGITDAVPAIRTITINGDTQDLSANRSWSVGTVTSVDMTVPTGFSISGRPITSSGTLALAFAAGYSLPTTAVQSNWTTAYNDSIVSAAVSGTTTKTLTLTQQDGGTITASWTDYDTAPVTSVNAGTGISVNQTTGAVTVTNTGTLTVAGTTNQVLVNGGTAAANGNMTLSLPQDIGTSNTPTFGGLIVSGTETRQINLVLPASYNVTGYGNLIERINFPWYSEYWDIGVRRGASSDIQSMEFWLNGTTKIFEITKTSGLAYLGGNTILHSGNYNSYAPTLTGTGASGTWGISISGNAATATSATTSTSSTYSTYLTSNSGSVSNGFVAWNSYDDTTNNPGNSWWYGMRVSHGDAISYYSFTISSGFFTNEVYYRKIQGGTAGAWIKFLDSGNYNSYSPTLTGGNASGTWGINVTGSAGSTSTLSYTYLGSGSVNVNNSNGAIYRTDSGSGAVLAYSPVLHIGGGDTMWQVQGSYGTSGNGTFYFRQGYNGSWGNWLTMLSSANYTSYAVPTSGYEFGTAFSLGTMYASTGVQGSNLDYMIGVYTNGYVYRFTSGAVASWIGLGSYLPLSGGTLTGTLFFSNNIGTAIQGTMGNNDFWRIYATGGDNAGYLEIATADDGAEPIYISQYSGVFSTLIRRITLLDGSGNTTFPGTVSISGGQNVSGNATWFGGYGSGSGPGISLENQSSFARFAFFGLDFYDWDHGVVMTLNSNYVNVPNYLQAGNSLRAPIFYDSVEPGYYLDPNSISNLRALTIGAYTQIGVTLPYPGANYGPGIIYIRLHPVQGRIASLKIDLSSTWNWAAAFGYVSADVSYYCDGTNLYYPTTTITSATGLASNSINIGNPVIENGYVSIPVYSANSNEIWCRIAGSPSFDWSQVTVSGWSSTSFPGQCVVNVPGPMSVGGTLTVSGNLTINGIWQTNISTSGGWSRLSFTASTAWGDPTSYGVLGVSQNGGNPEPGVMIYNPHIVWAGTSSGAGLRMGRSGGVASGAWYQVATMGSNEFMIAKNGDWGNGGIKITDAGVLYYGNTGHRYVWESGTWGINISGNAATATVASGVTWGNVSGKPAQWLNEPNLIEGKAPSATAFPSGFYQDYDGSGNPTGTWFNYINVRHSNTANGHGYQIGMSYYDNNLWFRSYQGSTSPTFGPWCRALSTVSDTYAANMNQYVRTTDAPTFSSNLYISADGSTGYVASRIWLYSHDNYRGAGVYMSGTNKTWFAGTPYTDFEGLYIIARTDFAGDGSCAQIVNRRWSIDGSGNSVQAGAVYANNFIDYDNNTYYLNLNSGGYLRGLIQITGGHYNSAMQVILRADENGASTGQVTLRAWCSEPGVTWDWAGFGYNVTNDGSGSYGFGRINTNFGQAYMRFSTGGQLRFYNTNTSGTRVETAIFAENGTVTFNYSVTASSFFEGSDRRIKDLIEDNYRAIGIESIRPRLYKKNGKIELGYYAQDVQPILSHAVSVNEDGFLNLSYREVHTAKIAYIEDSIEEIKAKILYLENQLKTKQ